jgi:6-pyruvoyltetrahydropterin/6-carboxytetrahydropterin synthase
LEGEQDGQFIIDFEELKGIVIDICDALDHRILLAGEDGRIQICEEGDALEVLIPGPGGCNTSTCSPDGGKRYVFPREDAVVLPIASISAEDLCKYINSRIASQIKDKSNITSVSVRVDEGVGQGAGCTYKIKWD